MQIPIGSEHILVLSAMVLVSVSGSVNEPNEYNLGLSLVVQFNFKSTVLLANSCAIINST